jgi:hypothetical protein
MERQGDGLVGESGIGEREEQDERIGRGDLSREGDWRGRTGREKWIGGRLGRR